MVGTKVLYSLYFILRLHKFFSIYEAIHLKSKKGMTEDEMVRWHHRLNGHEFEQAPGDNEGQGSLACCSPWGCKELDMTERLK